MRKCLRCGAEMIEGCGIKARGYHVIITSDEKSSLLSLSGLEAPKVAICPECGELSIYIENTEALKNQAYYRDFKNQKKQKEPEVTETQPEGANASQAQDITKMQTAAKPQTVTNLRDFPEYADKAARWFSGKWRIPLEAYEESMRECLANKDREVPGVPQWYMILNESDEIIAGAGVIANDFHDRPDLTPNLCALFVEEAHRKQGLAGMLLNYIRDDFAKMGTDRLYLVTDHTSFYERYGWEFFTTVHDSDGPTRLYISPKSDL